MENAPAFFQQYGSRILLGVILCLLAYILVQRHLNDKAQKAKDASRSLGGAIYALNQLQSIPINPEHPIPPDQLVSIRKQYVQEVENRVGEVLANADDPKVRAQGLIVRGDLNWLLANFPPLPTTRPSEFAMPKSSDEYLTAAAEAYNSVLQPPLNEDHQSVVAARLSLANIAENRDDWAKAKDYFQQVVDDPSAGKGPQRLAQSSIDQIKIIQKPVFISANAPEIPIKLGGPTEFGPSLPPGFSTSEPAHPTTAPSTQPSSSLPAATQPSLPAGPATQPAIVLPGTVPSSAPSAVTAPTTRPSHP
ncbi:MAG TPA: hypothetical protein VFE47_10755 [Tepidisphaeraceae bacterium]|nr:hypothetical protein [Tepidisphaeraceae bacterium]